MSVCVCVRAGVHARMCMFGGDRAEFYIHLKYFIYLWLCWVFVATLRLSLVVPSGDYSLVTV